MSGTLLYFSRGYDFGGIYVSVKIKLIYKWLAHCSKSLIWPLGKSYMHGDYFPISHERYQKRN